MTGRLLIKNASNSHLYTEKFFPNIDEMHLFLNNNLFENEIISYEKTKAFLGVGTITQIDKTIRQEFSTEDGQELITIFISITNGT